MRRREERNGEDKERSCEKTMMKREKYAAVKAKTNAGGGEERRTQFLCSELLCSSWFFCFIYSAPTHFLLFLTLCLCAHSRTASPSALTMTLASSDG